MNTPQELKFLRSIKTGKGLMKLIAQLRDQRRANKLPGNKRIALTNNQRQRILAKTDSRCHVCGTELTTFHADHVKSHITGGLHAENNYLPVVPPATTCAGITVQKKYN